MHTSNLWHSHSHIHIFTPERTLLEPPSLHSWRLSKWSSCSPISWSLLARAAFKGPPPSCFHYRSTAIISPVLSLSETEKCTCFLSHLLRHFLLSTWHNWEHYSKVPKALTWPRHRYLQPDSESVFEIIYPTVLLWTHRTEISVEEYFLYFCFEVLVLVYLDFTSVLLTFHDVFKSTCCFWMSLHILTDCLLLTSAALTPTWQSTLIVGPKRVSPSNPLRLLYLKHLSKAEAKQTG